MDQNEIALLYEELHHNGRSIIPSTSPANPTGSFHPIVSHPLALRPALVRWDMDSPLSVENCVLMENKDVLKHLKECGLQERKDGSVRKSPAEVWGVEVDEGARALGKEARRILSWRERSG